MIRRAMAAAVPFALVLGWLGQGHAVALPDPDPGVVNATASLVITASRDRASPGDTLRLTVDATCSAASTGGCAGAILNAAVPAPFELVSVDADTDATIRTAGSTATVSWVTDLGEGAVGLAAGATSTVSVTAVLPTGLSTDSAAAPVENVAALEGTNFVDQTASVMVTVVAPSTVAPTPPAAEAATPAPMSEAAPQDPATSSAPASSSPPADQPPSDPTGGPEEPAVSVGATKAIDPDVIPAGGSTVVTVTASNTSAVPIDTLTIREPASGSFPDSFIFDGFRSGIDYPAGATSCAVAYTLADGSTEIETFHDGATPAPAAGEVARFAVTFKGPIEKGATVALAYGITTDAELPVSALPLTHGNSVSVRAENRHATGEVTVGAVSTVVPHGPTDVAGATASAEMDPSPGGSSVAGAQPSGSATIASPAPPTAVASPAPNVGAAAGWLGLGVLLTLATVAGVIGFGDRRGRRGRHRTLA